MKRGRKPKPTNLKKLAGNPGKRPLNKNEPKLERSKPRCPSNLSPGAKREWRRVVPQLHKIGLLTQLDRAALIMYCEEWATYEKANEVLQETNEVIRNSNGNLVKNPMLSVKNQAFANAYRMLSLFGFDPSSRSQLVVIQDDEEEDPLEALLFKRQVKVFADE